MNKSANLSENKRRLSLATQNQEEEADLLSIKKTSKTTKKTIKDFQVVRGLGKGAFGRVYMIKERQDQQPLSLDQDILSLKEEGFQEEEPEQPENI